MPRDYTDLISEGMGSNHADQYAGQAVQGLGAVGTTALNEYNQNKPLSPFQQWAALVATGQVDAHDASIYARAGYAPEHLGIGQQPTGQPQPQPQAAPASPTPQTPEDQRPPDASYIMGPVQPAPGGLGATAPGPAPSPAQGLGAPSQPAQFAAAPSRPMMMPQTQQDYGSAIQVAPFVTRRDVVEQAAAAAADRLKNTNAFKASEGAANRGSREQIATGHDQTRAAEGEANRQNELLIATGKIESTDRNVQARISQIDRMIQDNKGNENAIAYLNSIRSQFMGLLTITQKYKTSDAATFLDDPNIKKSSEDTEAAANALGQRLDIFNEKLGKKFGTPQGGPDGKTVIQNGGSQSTPAYPNTGTGVLDIMRGKVKASQKKKGQ
jgi:hypothetical protein